MDTVLLEHFNRHCLPLSCSLLLEHIHGCCSPLSWSLLWSEWFSWQLCGSRGELIIYDSRLFVATFLKVPFDSSIRELESSLDKLRDLSFVASFSSSDAFGSLHYWILQIWISKFDVLWWWLEERLEFFFYRQKQISRVVICFLFFTI